MATSNRTTRSTQAKTHFRSTPQMPDSYFRCVRVPATTELAEGLRSILDSGMLSESESELDDIRDKLDLAFIIRQSSIPLLVKALTTLMLCNDETLCSDQSAFDAATALKHLSESSCTPNRA
jgi:hypothetical protein